MKKGRLGFVDLMRGLAMLVMIEVHVVNSMMDVALRNTGWFNYLNFINGLVAPSFIFISGFAFMLASQAKLHLFREFRYDFWKQSGRIVLIWFAGYMLHIPFFSYYKCTNIATHDHWMKFFSIDVLQCIALGLLVIFILRLAVKSDRAFLVVVTLLGIAAVVPAPYYYAINFEQWFPFYIAMYFTPVYYTIFPIFPWFGFMAAGVLCAWVFLKVSKSGGEGLFMRRLLFIGLLLAVVSLPLMFYLKDYMKLFSDVKPNILFFSGRLGCVFLILSFSYYYCEWRGEPSAVILYPSRESLAVYFMHLQLLHREVWWGRSIIQIYPNSLGFGASIAAALLVIAVMLPMARVWNYLKMKYRYFGRIAVWSMIVFGAVIFMLR
ncbi:MAG TPA: heparan-alpha-glucosaminide N-acetyltransferase domain-containing protein [Spirochaetota bacterium]|nr:heparan-alpha-glucosaminide N-acetyltransferase domain-containing protein [Spirochaetota bacterium]